MAPVAGHRHIKRANVDVSDEETKVRLALRAGASRKNYFLKHKKPMSE